MIDVYPVRLNGNGIKVNDLAPDFSDITFSLSSGRSVQIPDIASITYEHSLEPGIVRNVGPLPIAESTGQYTASGQFTIPLEDWRTLRAELALLPATNGGMGYMQKVFNISVMYSFGTLDMLDVLHTCRVKRVSRAFRSGKDALYVSVDLYVRKIVEDGVEAVSTMDTIAALAQGII